MRFAVRFAGFITLVYAGTLCAADEGAKPDLERGKQLATTVCGACHGADGRATAPTNPNLAGQHGDYIAAQLAAFKAGTRPSPIMQPMAAGLSPEDMKAVGAYYSMQKPVEGMARDKALVQRGEKLWRGGIKGVNAPACAGCHGASGHGIPSQYPRLAGQNAELTMGWLKAYASGARPHPVMTPIAAKLSENDTRALAEYISGLK
jgi:cytochrome c553